MDQLERARSVLAVAHFRGLNDRLGPCPAGSECQLVGGLAQAWGALDILATNAAAAAQRGLLELEDEAWTAGFGRKVFASPRVIQQIWPLLKASSGHLAMIGGGTCANA